MDGRDVVGTAILAAERGWLDRWVRGDPSGYLEVGAPDVRYFDTYLGHWVSGIEAVRSHLESLRGKVHVDRYEMRDTDVRYLGAFALVTYTWVGFVGPDVSEWCCSEIYHHEGSRWRIVCGSWNAIKPTA